MTGKPAKKLRLDRRGELQEGYFADVVVFDNELSPGQLRQIETRLGRKIE